VELRRHAQLLEHGLAQIEIQRKDAIATLVDRAGQAVKSELPDPWQPLREVTAYLLPHMEFAGVDVTNPDAVAVHWRVHGRDTYVDLDDLSSGEKSIVQIFYPLVEHSVKQLLEEIRESVAPAERSDVCVLIDEPELHLHPNLQLKVFDYLRVLASRDHIQVVVATHSPTIVEAASFEELYLLRPVELVTQTENQLVQVADDEERLAFLRDVFGTTANLTALQPVVIVEGTRGGSSRSVTDRKLYRALHPRFDQVTLLAGGGKAEALRLAETVAEVFGVLSPKLKVVAFLDRDIAPTETDGVVYLPVSMIENFLLDPDAIWEATQSVAERAHFETVEAVQQALDAILDHREESEIERRTIARLGDARFRPTRPVADISDQLRTFIDATTARFAPDQIETAMDAARLEVQELRASNRRREMFHGKDLVDDLFRIHLHSTGLSQAVFKFEAARYARRRQAVRDFFEQFFAALDAPSPTGNVATSPEQT
jgi:hypothetical protein